MEFMSHLEDGSLGISSDDDLRGASKAQNALQVMLTMTNQHDTSTLKISERLHLVHLILLYHWEHNNTTIASTSLDIVSQTLRNDLFPLVCSVDPNVNQQQHANHSTVRRNSYKSKDAEDLTQTCFSPLDQLAHQLFSFLQYNDAKLPWLYTSSNIHRQVCDLITVFIDYDERYLIKFGNYSLLNDNISVVQVLALHRKDVEDLLARVQATDTEIKQMDEAEPNPVDINKLRDEWKQSLLYHIGAVADLGRIICKLTNSFDNQLLLHTQGICQELYSILNLFPTVIHWLESNYHSDSVESKKDRVGLSSFVEVITAVFAVAQNGRNKNMMGELGVNLILLEALDKYHDERDLVVVACQCLRHIANDKIATERVKLGAAGACQILTRILKEHQHDLPITKEVSATIWVVADYWKNKIEFSDAGAYQTLFVLLTLHKDQSEVLEPALGALSAIAVNKDDQYFLKECGVCDLVVELMQRHLKVDLQPNRRVISTGLVQQACALIWSLALHEDNQLNFHDIHTLELLWKVLQLYNKDVLVLEQVLGAMEALNRNCDASLIAQHWKFAFQGDRKDVLVELLMLNATYAEIIERLCTLIRQLSAVEEFKNIFTHSTFIFDVLSDCMEFHGANAKLMKKLEELRMNFIIY